MAARAALVESALLVPRLLSTLSEFFFAMRTCVARFGVVIVVVIRLPLVDVGEETEAARIPGHGRSTLLPAHPVRSVRCARQVSWLTARSRFVLSSREPSPSDF